MSKTLQMYGLSHCSTCQKAIEALEGHGWNVDFRDVQKDPLSEAERARLVTEWGDKIINRASLTWRGMSEEERAEDPVAMMGAKPSVMKRPAIAADDQRLLGWTANVKRALDVPA
ncbi:hypothetical protein MLD63_06005 [Paracoccus sp. TK19116]|uniref:Arsenate reductase, glutaredoxin family n=1 Tax=Paracoccus albicereus TaxID=2922394 RepID=A0ABT1MRL1_9RHOB|nr:ArsC/Spx/MgsR family protein [Paracoccus albicereus]MCQ0969978.1 hypothetical protein [Paracoccus albicereus]